jgi:hypothetical protein
MARPEVGASGGHGRDYNARAQHTLQRRQPSRGCARHIAATSFLHSRTDLDDTSFHFLQFLTWIRLISHWARASQALYITERSYTGGEDTRSTLSAAKGLEWRFLGLYIATHGVTRMENISGLRSRLFILEEGTRHLLRGGRCPNRQTTLSNAYHPMLYHPLLLRPLIYSLLISLFFPKSTALFSLTHSFSSYAPYMSASIPRILISQSLTSLPASGGTMPLIFHKSRLVSMTLYSQSQPCSWMNGRSASSTLRRKRSRTVSFGLYIYNQS